jgi:DNA-binding NtrC family response regulator
MNRRVLIVDGDGEVQARCRQLLQAQGFEVLGVSSGKDGLAALERERFGLVVSDYHMTDMHAGVFVRTVLARHPHLPQALLTGPGERLVSMIGMPVLHKPVSCESLLRVLERHCGHQRLAPRPAAAPEDPKDSNVDVAS